MFGTGLFDTRTDYQDGKVTFGALEGAASVAGDYRAQYALAAGVNLIDIKGNATVTRSEVVQTCTSDCSVVEKDKLLESGTVTLKAYGVEIQMPELPVMVLDGDGLTVGDYEVPYTIVPAEYTAGSAVVYVYQDNGLIEVLPAEVSGQGFIKFSSGSHFEITSDYEVEVVLNIGTTAEIKTERKPLMIAQLMLINDENYQYVKPEKELKYSRGESAKKRYRVAVRRGREFLKVSSCEDFTATISAESKRDSQSIPPPSDKYAKATVDLKFVANFNVNTSFTDACVSVSAINESMQSFFITNLKLAELGDVVQTRQPIYGGIGSKLSLVLQSNNDLHPINALREFAIEPVGVVVIALDGLRQDVLYSSEERAFTPDANYYIPPTQLTGLCEILGGKHGTGGCNIDDMADKHIKMKDVTAIFPSITLASWASVFTGSQPKDTGIMGNEFFARDLYPYKVSGLFDLPDGMVTLSDGAFGNKSEFLGQYLLPAENYNQTTRDRLARSTPNAVMKGGVETIYEWIGSNEGISELYKAEDYCMAGGECRSAAFYNHYGRGADLWSTMDLNVLAELGISYEFVGNSLKFVGEGLPIWEEIVSYSFDSFANKGVDKFIKEYYPTTSVGNRDLSRRFPALFVVYYAGLDHYAHGVGMDGYPVFFKEITDKKVLELVEKLKSIGEFDNKIFIVVADHGHTAMPTLMTYRDKETGGLKQADTSCKYRGDKFDKPKIQRRETNNNNLHIWELAEMLRLFPVPGLPLKVLAPKEIVAASSGSVLKAEDANVIAALNGPMAHIYVKGTSWKSDPDQSTLIALLQRLSQAFSINSSMQGEDYKTLVKSFPKLTDSIDTILVREKRSGEYREYLGIKLDTQGKTTIDSKSLEFKDHDYVRAIDRVNNLNNPDRSGDILLIMKDNTNNAVVARFTSGVACKSWHGSLNPSDSYVPYIFSYPGGNKQEIENLTETVCANDKCNGNWAVTETVKTILEKQFQ